MNVVNGEHWGDEADLHVALAKLSLAEADNSASLPRSD